MDQVNTCFFFVGKEFQTLTDQAILGNKDKCPNYLPNTGMKEEESQN